MGKTGNTRMEKSDWKAMRGYNILNQSRLAKSADDLPTSITAYRSIPFAITVSNLELGRFKV